MARESEPRSQNGTEVNGQEVNGQTLNGQTLNSQTLNGQTLNGLRGKLNPKCVATAVFAGLD
jgi:hypothetical protein